LLRQFFTSLTDVDGRAWRTVRALLLQPGLLSREYFEGRRGREGNAQAARNPSFPTRARSTLFLATHRS
jgi:hypothetical protein